MNPTTTALTALYNCIPRRHTPDNVKEIYSIINDYEALLIKIEAEHVFYEKNIPRFFDQVEDIRAAIKKSSDNKASKKSKDIFFDEGSGLLKDNMQELMEMYADGKQTD